MNIKSLAEQIGASTLELARGDEEIICVTGIEDGVPGALTFVGNPLYERFLASTKATAAIVSEYQNIPYAAGEGPAILRAKSPYEAFARALEMFSPVKERPAKGIHPSSVVDPSAVIDADAHIGAHVYIGRDATIGPRTIVRHGAYVGAATTIGADCEIHPNVVIYDHMQIGDRVVVGAGSVIGFDGFGYVPMGDGSYRKIPQIGIVVLEDDVEVGANTTIDRATVAETRIRKGVKLDNLIQIAHNVDVGEHTVMAAQAGVSGSTKIGRANILAGQSGVTGHIQTTEHVIVGAQSGVSKSITKPGTYMGYPARPGREVLKQEGAMRSLPDLIERVKKLEEELIATRAKVNANT
ncbi:MAG: UDP-3-O-(3-hydroxymyristoyl)glucosamine N-acyltransferase [Bacteroidota bacterium]|nr:UDP-3-O-(3-hydroxymyristoyl)glucosamine N-acyltransferase [Bacteroidota bacterium]MDP4232396.1 UDP-3-O-(3-hydroxymyristoyl)glucosamine N-acyltransferase [Bacteroidota bacterium]MDP4241533.1 UDP-3-O-(3-hydroxymyristoyl)glucosamine N-acyltransferase [Bacteroidota bacterium]MDP4288267.1 UDP-3-O-(3-hydroxymyristoyl)glucosamine N-acyltransferase [Bacteroidota bacterium]